MEDDDIIRDGAMVIVQMNDGNKSTQMLKVASKGTQKVGRLRIPVKHLIDAPYGSIFQVSILGV